MTNNNSKYIIYSLTLAGTLFSGFLSGVKLFTDNCALGEACPLFLGYPACYFGFALFLTLFTLSNFLVFRKTKQAETSKTLAIVSTIGVIFSGYYVVQEFIWFSINGFQWSQLGLPTCAYGLIFYVLVFVFILKYRKYVLVTL